MSPKILLLGLAQVSLSFRLRGLALDLLPLCVVEVSHVQVDHLSVNFHLFDNFELFKACFSFGNYLVQEKFEPQVLVILFVLFWRLFPLFELNMFSTCV